LQNGREPGSTQSNPVILAMRQRISDLRKSIRSRENEFALLSHDTWIRANSEIDAQKLHALGVVTFRWNVCENKVMALFWTLLNRPPEEAQIISHDLTMTEVVRRIKALAVIKLKKDKRLVAAIENALEVFDVCRLNRNQFTHFTFSFVSEPSIGPWPHRYRLALARKSRKPEYRENVPFPDSIEDIRRVAKDIRRLNGSLRNIERRTFAKIRGSRRIKLRDWPLSAPLSLPELLWPPKEKNEEMLMALPSP
jgi:hypothetical protein